jgi:hypothetical protein
MKALSLWLPFVLPYAYACSDPMAEQAILSACIDFCSKSMIVQNVNAEGSVVGLPDYDVEEPAQQQLAKVLAVFYRNRRLVARSAEMVQSAVALRGEAIGADEIPTGSPAEWFVRDLTQPVVSIFPAPDEAVAGAVTIKAALVPTRTATTVADILFTDYCEDIAAGAIGRLMLMPNQPFSSPAAATPYLARFAAAITSAANTARTGQAAASSRVKPRPFA